ncbi:hypothetical protein LEP1GSC043_3370 [Leptospira weilii str. Ecochallenge]|uniref:STML2-like C-terminal extension domain-containing protein n=1 Tax=Leptospira weilii str. Ecochallenge TaxID=1049986 RepID=N1U476_9LEPT|nr:hypothetical protein LEP1GSC043_3370 [Leptospira weilii str. Ecochallenge]
MEAIAVATAKGIELLAQSINTKGGQEAVKLRIGQKFIKEFEKISGKKAEIVLPLNLTNFRSILKSVLGNTDQKN